MLGVTYDRKIVIVIKFYPMNLTLLRKNCLCDLTKKFSQKSDKMV